MKKILPLILVLIVALTACKKDTDTFDAQKQLETDLNTIKNYIAKNNIPALAHESGVYYVITDAGTGDYKYESLSNTAITVKYTGKLLSGDVFDSNTIGVTFEPPQVPRGLAGLITAWQYGLAPKLNGGIVTGGLQKGGKIRLITPSGYAYGPYAQGKIPANSVLDFEIELLDVKKIN